MKAAVIGLGLIGASFAKGLKKNTDFTVLGYDNNPEVMMKAIRDGVVDGNADGCLSECDIIILGLYPEAAIKFTECHAEEISKNAVVADVGGVKARVCEGIAPIADKYGFTFIGMHPMAGIEKFGYDNSKDDMFNGASLIMTPKDNTPKEKIELLKNAVMPLGFSQIRISDPEEHDKIIAYTSQLAHVVSSSYIKSPTALRHSGFSAGSFKDMTRVAHLNEVMWTELFLDNAENLADETDTIIKNLTDFSHAIRNKDKERLLEMLRDGREKKDLADNCD